jgi:hypothetical protein
MSAILNIVDFSDSVVSSLNDEIASILGQKEGKTGGKRGKPMNPAKAQFIQNLIAKIREKPQSGGIALDITTFLEFCPMKADENDYDYHIRATNVATTLVRGALDHVFPRGTYVDPTTHKQRPSPRDIDAKNPIFLHFFDENGELIPRFNDENLPDYVARSTKNPSAKRLLSLLGTTSLGSDMKVAFLWSKSE